MQDQMDNIVFNHELQNTPEQKNQEVFFGKMMAGRAGEGSRVHAGARVGHAQPRCIGDVDVAVLSLYAFVTQIVSHGRILDAVLEQKGISARTEPVQTCRSSDG